MTDCLATTMAMLGPARNHYADPSAWERLHAGLGLELPSDYRTLVGAYAPIGINGHLSLHHPATERWNLGRWIKETVTAWSDVPWDGLGPDEDPRLLLGIEELSFGTRHGLWPLASTDRGETVFLAEAATATATTGATGTPYLVVAAKDGIWARHRMGFAEWLHRYLVGEDMAGPGSSALYPGPVRPRHLPMSAGDRPEPWYGPDRGM
jgi:hypothetical protein